MNGGKFQPVITVKLSQSSAHIKNYYFLYYKSQTVSTEGMLEISLHHSINLKDPGNSLEFFAMFQELNVK